MKQIFQDKALLFFSDYRFKWQSRLFKQLLYLFLLIKSVYWLVFYNLYFGPQAIVYNAPMAITSFKDLSYILYASSWPFMAYVFIVPIIFVCVLALAFKRKYILSDLIIWFLVVNLNNKIYPTLTGGDYLLNQFLFFAAFLSMSGSQRSEGKGDDLKVLIHNFSTIAIMVQLCIVYFLSALAKCNDMGWMSGTALATLSQIKHFNLYNSSRFGFYTVLTYGVVFYQLVFPVLVWIKKIKKPFIIFGLLMHLYIAFVMGLPEFGFIMIIGYIFFWPFKKSVS